MRKYWFTLCAGLLSAVLLGAQQPAPPADPLDQILDNWERAMSSMKSFTAQVNRTEIEVAFQTKDVWSGEAKFVKGTPGTSSRASLVLVKSMNPPPKEVPFEKILFTGNFLFQYSQATKEIIVHEMPQNPGGQIADDNILAFLFGRRAAAAKQRYEMKLVPVPEAQAKFYNFISIKPRQEADKQDFSEARLVLWANGTATPYLPVQFWFRQPTGKEVTWDFPKVNPNIDIPLQEFDPPTNPPQGWKLTKPPQQQLKVRN